MKVTLLLSTTRGYILGTSRGKAIMRKSLPPAFELPAEIKNDANLVGVKRYSTPVGTFLARHGKQGWEAIKTTGVKCKTDPE